MKRGITRVSIESLLSHTTEKLRTGTLLCFTKFLIPKISINNEEGEEEGGSITIFFKKFFCLTVPKKFVMESLNVSQSFKYRKILWKRERGEGGIITNFCKNDFVSQCQKSS